VKPENYLQNQQNTTLNSEHNFYAYNTKLLFCVCKLYEQYSLCLLLVVTTGSPFVIGVEDTKDSKPKDGRR